MSLSVTQLILAILGVINAGYLAWHHYQKKPLICPLNHDCNAVVESEWATMFGVRNEVLGILYYLAIGVGVVIAIILSDYRTTIHNGMLIISALAVIFSLMLLYIQKYVIKDFCFYCSISAIINVLILANSIALVI